MAKTSKRYNLYSAFIAFVLWGGWAYYINVTNGFFTGLTSGLVQGTFSFVMTLVIVFIVSKIYNQLNHRALQLLLPPIMTVIGTSIPLVAIHSLMGTPYILKTIAPALSVSFIFCVMTTLNLRRCENGQT